MALPYGELLGAEPLWRSSTPGTHNERKERHATTVGRPARTSLLEVFPSGQRPPWSWVLEVSVLPVTKGMSMRDIEDGGVEGDFIVLSRPMVGSSNVIPRWLAWLTGKD